MREKEVTKNQWLCTQCNLMYSTLDLALDDGCGSAVVKRLIKDVHFVVGEDGADLFTTIEKQLTKRKL